MQATAGVPAVDVASFLSIMITKDLEATGLSQDQLLTVYRSTLGLLDNPNLQVFSQQ